MSREDEPMFEPSRAGLLALAIEPKHVTEPTKVGSRNRKAAIVDLIQTPQRGET